MPVIRCSNEVYKLLQDKALQDNEPVSIVLDRIVFLELKKPKPKLEPKPKRKRKAKAHKRTEPEQTVYELVRGSKVGEPNPKRPMSKAMFTGIEGGGYQCLVCNKVFKSWREARAHALSEHPS